MQRMHPSQLKVEEQATHPLIIPAWMCVLYDTFHCVFFHRTTNDQWKGLA